MSAKDLHEHYNLKVSPSSHGRLFSLKKMYSLYTSWYIQIVFKRYENKAVVLRHTGIEGIATELLGASKKVGMIWKQKKKK